MSWKHYRDLILVNHYEELPADWVTTDDYQGLDMSIAALWSWRGVQCKKYLGFYPKPEEIGLAADHAFYDADLVDISMMRDSSGKAVKVFCTHHGRKIRRTERLWKERVADQLDLYRSRGEIPEGCPINGLALGAEHSDAMAG